MEIYFLFSANKLEKQCNKKELGEKPNTDTVSDMGVESDKPR